MAIMQTQTREPRFINVRKLVALDLALRGTWFILIEFTFAVALGVALGTFVLARSLGTPSPFVFGILAGLFLLAIGLNYVPLLIYAIAIVRRKSARAEVATELAQRNIYAHKYGVQQALLVVPLAIPLLALFQEVRRRRARDAPEG